MNNTQTGAQMPKDESLEVGAGDALEMWLLIEHFGVCS